MNNKQLMAFCRLKTIGIVSLLTLALFVVPVFAEGSFTDVALNYWGAPYIESAVKAGIIKGYEIEKTDTFVFKPENMVSKQESLAMLYRTLSKAGLLKETADLSAEYKATLSRCSIADWATMYVAYGFKYGFVEESDFAASTKTAKGGAVNAQRQTVAMWSAKAMNYELSPISILPYTDGKNVVASMIPYVDALYRNGIMMGDTAKAFHPTDGIKRSEFAAICTRLLASAKASGADVQAARNFQDSFIVDSGTVTDINILERTLRLKTVDGNEHRLQLAWEATVVLNGREVAFSELSVLWNKPASVSCLLGAGKQVLIQTQVPVLTGTIKRISYENDYAIVSVENEMGMVIKYCYNDDTVNVNVIAEGEVISFIADGVYLLETK